MLDTTQTLTRVIALVFSTAMFAGLWANDQPPRILAQKTMPLPDPVVQQEPGIAPVAPPVPMPEPLAENSADLVLSISVGAQTKTLTIDSDGLALSREMLFRHLEQLPLGVAAGDYRVVDPMGGVGWLRVRINGAVPDVDGVPIVLTTSINFADVRYIRVAPTMIGSSAEIIRK